MKCGKMQLRCRILTADNEEGSCAWLEVAHGEAKLAIYFVSSVSPHRMEDNEVGCVYLAVSRRNFLVGPSKVPLPADGISKCKVDIEGKT
jgi:hypothetical protein